MTDTRYRHYVPALLILANVNVSAQVRSSVFIAKPEPTAATFDLPKTQELAQRVRARMSEEESVRIQELASEEAREEAEFRAKRVATTPDPNAQPVERMVIIRATEVPILPRDTRKDVAAAIEGTWRTPEHGAMHGDCNYVGVGYWSCPNPIAGLILNAKRLSR